MKKPCQGRRKKKIETKKTTKSKKKARTSETFEKQQKQTASERINGRSFQGE